MEATIMKSRTKDDSRYIVSFLDILGYSEIICRDDTERKEELFKAVTEMVDRTREVTGRIIDGAREKGLDGLIVADSLGFRAFSDNIVVYCGLCPESDDRMDNLRNNLAVSAVVMIQSWIQARLLSGYRILSRGGITIGHLIVSDDFLFGEALVDAYRLEEAAATPRIIVDREVRDLFRRSADRCGYGTDWDRDGSFMTDVDGEIFIPYLTAQEFSTPLMSGGHDAINRRRILEEHYDGLSRAIGENEDAIRRDRRTRHKYIWAASYHNREAEISGFEKRFDIRTLQEMDSPIPKKRRSFHRRRRAPNRDRAVRSEPRDIGHIMIWSLDLKKSL